MLNTEYVRNCNCNYERLLLEQKPEQNRYQYCILNRGGIRYLLPASLRYLNGEAYMYYDISSTQSISQLFSCHTIKREWLKDFLWEIKQLRQELDRFLLDELNILWYPEHIFQDLEKNDFSFLYIPYYEGDNGLCELMDFLIEHIDYEDEMLVEFVYAVYEQIKEVGLEYFQKKIHEDWLLMERKEKGESKREEMIKNEIPESYKEMVKEQNSDRMKNPVQKESPKWSFRFLKDGKRKKNEQKEDYRDLMRQRLNGTENFAVCEDSVYHKENIEIAASEEFGEEYGKTIYIEEVRSVSEPALYKADGEMAAKLDAFPYIVGKKKENVNLALNDYSVSRIHARITMEDGVYYIEDLNSTNGTFKNGLRMNPYEKRKLEREDELRFGKLEFVYR